MTTRREILRLATGAGLAAAGPTQARAAQVWQPVELADGTLTRCADCVACHSLDYIQLNSPFLDRKGWEATVTKMSKAFGASTPPADVPVLVEYLAVNYGKK